MQLHYISTTKSIWQKLHGFGCVFGNLIKMQNSLWYPVIEALIEVNYQDLLLVVIDPFLGPFYGQWAIT